MSQLRDSNIAKLEKQVFDVVITGGGINGAVSAAALAARGVKVALVDKGDFAGQTSSNSSNLAWGGIKYLESGEFLLVNKLCKSRNHLMRSYPSTVKEVRFLTSIQKGFRFPPFFIYLGTWLYWLMGRLFTDMPKYLTTEHLNKREPMINTADVAGGFEYSDAYLFDNDARFVFNFVRSAMSHGCIAANYVEVTHSERRDNLWHTLVQDKESGQQYNIRSKAFINAAGPWVDGLNQITQINTSHHHVFSKGIHLIVDRITETRRVLTFFASDGRMFFVIPMGPKTCIGTTDTQVDSPQAEVSEADRDFVLSNINQLLALEKPFTREDIIAERCGVRPLAIKGKRGKADWVQLSRKHAIDVNQRAQHLSIFGGKLTDCINVGNEVVEHVQRFGIHIPHPHKRWYGEPDDAVKQEFFHRAKLMDLDNLTPAYSSEPLSQRFWRRYGRNAINMLEQIREQPHMADPLIENSEYLRVEIEHAARREMITKLEDFLRRRSKMALVVRRENILRAPGIKELCLILFGDKADTKLEEYKASLMSDTESTNHCSDDTKP